MKHQKTEMVERVSRFTLGLIWVYQGTVPKWLWQVPYELAIVERSKLYLVSPGWTIAAIGVLETGIGIWLLWGVRRRLAVLSATGCMLILQAVVVAVAPELLVGPFGGLTKNWALITLAWLVWTTTPKGGHRCGSLN